MGRPAVAFDLKETRVSAQGAATYARPNDVSDLATKLLELLADPQRRAEMGHIGLERVKGELSWEHSQPALLAAYAHALDGLRDMSRGPEPLASRGHTW